MAVIEEGLISYLQGYSGLTALISTRTYGMRIPQSATLPCLVVQRVTTPRISTMQSSGRTGDFISPRFQLDAWAETQSSSNAINEQVRAALNGKKGSIGSGGQAVTIRAALAAEEVPTYEPESELYRTRSEYVIFLEEA